MPLFRFHRGSLKDSLATTVIVVNADDLYKAICNEYDMKSLPHPLTVVPYPNEELCFDDRIGWYTQIVTTVINDERIVIGFLSEPFLGSGPRTILATGD